MPIAIADGNGMVMREEDAYSDEYELQGCIERHPNLLLADGEPAVVAVHRELSLPNAGSLDILMVDAEGTPFATEVKLYRNTQSRREVVAQAFDYVSDLSEVTYDELDDEVEGKLSLALDKIRGTVPFQEMRKRCATNLRAGRIKLIVATDKASASLIRIVQYVNDHSDIDARLVTIGKYDGGRVFVPRLLVHKSTAGVYERERSVPSADPYYQKIVDEYDSRASGQLLVRGKGKKWRDVRPDDWPEDIHYAFGDDGDTVEIGLHIEDGRYTKLVSALVPLDGHRLPGEMQLTWTLRKQGGGWLWCSFDKTTAPSAVADAMEHLIALTRDTVDEHKCEQPPA